VVEGTLVGGVRPEDGVGDLPTNVGDGVEHAPAAEPLTAVPKLLRFEGSGGGTGGHDRGAAGS
jgi:hypothetical protein